VAQIYHEPALEVRFVRRAAGTTSFLTTRKLLDIQSSPRGQSSDSITLTKSFIEACKSNDTSIVVDTLNVWQERQPEFDSEAIGAKYKAVKHETMTEAESNAWERIQSLIQRFRKADRIVLGMWNFGLPYKLKQLIDLVAQRNYLFSYDGKTVRPSLERGEVAQVHKYKLNLIAGKHYRTDA
jgi:FMN-dependent NADH-azoreductase